MTRIAVDAMGGDHAPFEIVAGAVWAAHDYKVPIELIGKEDVIKEELDRIAKNGIRYNRGGLLKFLCQNIKIDISKLR